jgi:hypothetical protein
MWSVRNIMSLCLKFFIFTYIFLNTAYCSDSAIAPEQAGLWVEQPSSLQPLNESSYNKVTDQIWKQYNDDFNYSSLILDEYVKKNISPREAFISTISLYVLNGRTLNVFKSINPPEKYSENHNRAISAFINLEDFFWYMAKYYETQEKIYAIQARNKFNESTYYYNQIHKS